MKKPGGVKVFELDELPLKSNNILYQNIFVVMIVDFGYVRVDKVPGRQASNDKHKE